MNTPAGEPPRFLTPTEVAQLFHVTPTTVTRWANTGRLHPTRTLGGWRRYREAEVLALLEANGGLEDSGESAEAS